MPRRKITIQRIANEAIRRSTHERLSAGLLQKVQELSTLCSVSARVVIYGIGDDTEPKAWPSLPEATHMLQATIEMRESSKGKTMLDTKSHLRLNIAMAEKKLHKKRAQNRQLEINTIMNDVITSRRKNKDDLDPELIDNLKRLLGMLHQEVHNRIDMLRSKATP